ncbi:NAD(P)/FAD-dependent oxidoreductase [uncultured Serinicoccus sp.]|uniref:flavin-containing monooxygenase n=1 Tax=uncultured Serinicoccus sp. TaxID=735514 RepID=UPI00261E7AF2|nr:NAD(P)/FAD-dependent oxidoreductase [uncultured Serinicoccus sp.]
MDQYKYYDAVVVGAGFAGLYAAHKLSNEGNFSVKGIEAGSGVGGTWHWNRYPGARCDTEGYIYCYSFSEELLEEWDWEGKYPTQPEILEYLNHVTDRFGLRQIFDFNTRVAHAHYLEAEQMWDVRTDDGERYRARYLVLGIGHLSIARYVPEIPGLDSFSGEWHHTAAWPEGTALEGKRVAVLGTGSTGVQVVSEIASKTAELYVLQRTPQYAIPAQHHTIGRQELTELKGRYGQVWDVARHSAGGYPWQHNGRSVLEDTAVERNETLEMMWNKGGLEFAYGSYRDISLDRRANDIVSEFIREKTRERITNEAMWDHLVPVDFPFLARRPIVETNYYEVYANEHVHLCDLRYQKFEGMVPEGIVIDGEVVPIDVMIFATGFDAITGPYFGIDIQGAGGQPLREAWQDGPNSYLGLMTHGFPNMFMLTGPGSTTGNLPVSIENHVDWVHDLMKWMDANGNGSIQPDIEAQRMWTETVGEQAYKSVIPLAESWFTGSNIPGKKKSFLFYLGHFGSYREECQRVASSGYEGFEVRDRV